MCLNMASVLLGKRSPVLVNLSTFVMNNRNSIGTDYFNLCGMPIKLKLWSKTISFHYNTTQGVNAMTNISAPTWTQWPRCSPTWRTLSIKPPSTHHYDHKSQTQQNRRYFSGYMDWCWSMALISVWWNGPRIKEKHTTEPIKAVCMTG